MENEQPETANDHKERGNECIKTGNFSEAILHYSFAIKLNPNEATFYSNRSLAFLKLKQLYYANEDADKAIQLKPDWAKVGFLSVNFGRSFQVEMINFVCVWYIDRVIFGRLKYKRQLDNMIYHCYCMDVRCNYNQMI